MWTFIALHNAFGLVDFMSRQFELALLFNCALIMQSHFLFQYCFCFCIPKLSTMSVCLVLGSVLGTSLLCVIHGATIENTLFKYGVGANTIPTFNQTLAKETVYCFWSQIFVGVVSLGLNLCACDFVHAVEDPDLKLSTPKIPLKQRYSFLDGALTSAP
ncbi:Photosystem II D2 protein [Bienertia sinuspersici]